MRVVANVVLALCITGSSILAQPPEVVTTDRICSVLVPIMEEKRELSGKGLKLRAAEVAKQANKAFSDLLRPGIRIKSTRENPFHYSGSGGVVLRGDEAFGWDVEAETSYSTFFPDRFSASERTSRAVQMKLEEWASRDDDSVLRATIEVFEVELDKIRVINTEDAHRLKAKILSLESVPSDEASDTGESKERKGPATVTDIIVRIRADKYSSQEEIAKDLEKISTP